MRKPSYARQIAPSSRPARPIGVGQAVGRANAEIAASVAQAGGSIAGVAAAGLRDDLAMIESSAERQLDEFWLQFHRDLSTRSDLAQTDASGRTGFERVPEEFERQWNESFDRIMAGLPRPVQDRLSVYSDKRRPYAADRVMQLASQLQSNHWRSQTFADVRGYAGSGEVQAAMVALERGRQWLDPDEVQGLDAEAGRLAAKYHEDQAWSAVQNVAAVRGWDAAAEFVNRPDVQQKLGLDADEVGRLTGRVHQQAAMEEKQRQEALDQAKDQVLRDTTAAFYHGQLTPGQLDQHLSDGTLTPEQYSGFMDGLTKPKAPTREQALAANIVAKGLVQQVGAGNLPAEQALTELVKQAGAMSSGEAGQFVDEITEAAKANQKAHAETAKAKLYSRVLKGEVTDLSELEQAAEAKVITPAEYEGLYRLATGPRRAGHADVLNSHVAVQAAIADVRAGRRTIQDGMGILAQHAGVISEAEGASYAKQMAEAADPANLLSTPLAKKGREYLDQLRTSKAFGGDDGTKNSEAWLQAVDNYNAWVQANPTASAEQHQSYLRYLSTPVLMSWWKNMSPVQTTEGIRRLPAEARDQWTATGGANSDEWLQKFRRIRKPLTLDVARHYLKVSGGDQTKAQAMAKEDGYAE